MDTETGWTYPVTFDQMVERAAENSDKTIADFEELKNKMNDYKKKVKKQAKKILKYFEEDKEDKINSLVCKNIVDTLNSYMDSYTLYRFDVNAKKPIVEAVKEKINQESN